MSFLCKPILSLVSLVLRKKLYLRSALVNVEAAGPHGFILLSGTAPGFHFCTATIECANTLFVWFDEGFHRRLEHERASALQCGSVPARSCSTYPKSAVSLLGCKADGGDGQGDLGWVYYGGQAAVVVNGEAADGRWAGGGQQQPGVERVEVVAVAAESFL